MGVRVRANHTHQWSNCISFYNCGVQIFQFRCAKVTFFKCILPPPLSLQLDDVFLYFVVKLWRVILEIKWMNQWNHSEYSRLDLTRCQLYETCELSTDYYYYCLLLLSSSIYLIIIMYSMISWYCSSLWFLAFIIYIFKLIWSLF